MSTGKKNSISIVVAFIFFTNLKNIDEYRID